MTSLAFLTHRDRPEASALPVTCRFASTVITVASSWQLLGSSAVDQAVHHFSSLGSTAEPGSDCRVTQILRSDQCYTVMHRFCSSLEVS